jgi:GTP-binding protein
MRARFFRAIANGGAFPRSPRREVVFCGRSNVGKSSLLNALTGVQGLARTSKTPGRTREIHFYEEGHDRYLVDLPGYGYAKVPVRERRVWAELVESYLARRDRIALAVLLVDARHEPFESDLQLAEWLSSGEIPFIVALTKTDKLGTSGRSAALGRARAAFASARACLLTSAVTKTGIRDLAAWVTASVAGRAHMQALRTGASRSDDGAAPDDKAR